MPKKSLIKSLLSNEKEILQAANDCNFYALHKTDKKKAYTVLFEKLKILKKLSTKKKFREAEEKFRLFFYRRGHPGLKESNASQIVDSNASPVVDSNVSPVVDSNASQIVDSNASPVVDSNASQIVDSNVSQT